MLVFERGGLIIECVVELRLLRHTLLPARGEFDIDRRPILMTHPTRHFHVLVDGRVQCDVCPRACKMHEGQRGLCFVRGVETAEVKLYTYGRSSGFCVDPIEKKPLNHFLPGTAVLSFGT